jgi:Tfp pilus assembly protein PilV
MTTRTSHRVAGFVLMEVLITVVILAFGLLGLAGFRCARA